MNVNSGTKDSLTGQRHRLNFNIVTLPDGIIQFSATPELLDRRRKKREQKLWPTTRMPRRVISPQEISDISGMMTQLEVGTSNNQESVMHGSKNPFSLHRTTQFTTRRRLTAVRRRGMAIDYRNSPSTPGRDAMYSTVRFGCDGSSKDSASPQSCLKSLTNQVTKINPVQVERTAAKSIPQFKFSVPSTHEASAGNIIHTVSDTTHKKWHGLRRTPFVPLVTTYGQFQCLTIMKEYDHKSFEELRFEDYLSGKRLAKSTSHYGPKFEALSTSDYIMVRGVSRLVKGNIQCIPAMQEYKDRSFEELRIEHYAPSLGWKDRDRYSLPLGELQHLPISLDSEVFFYRESRKKGKVRFIGRLPHKNPKDVFVGVELDDFTGLGNGCSGGVRLFRCKDLCAEFAPIDSILPKYLVHSEEEKVKVPFLEESSSPPSSGSGGNKCAVCWTNEVQIFFQPCGHVCCCERCSKSMKDCPVCRKAIKQKLRAFLT